jgi:hypothetical protein
MPQTNTEIKDAIAKASEAMDKDPSLKGTVAAKQYRAIYSRLIKRRNGRPPSSSRGGHNKKLSEPQDNALKDYLYMLYALGTSTNLEVLINALNRLLYFLGSVETVSRRWAKKWIVRNTDFFKTVRSKLIAV